MNDIIFLSYDETNAEKNWHALRCRFPHAQRVHGIKGVKQAHQKAAQLARSEFFFIVDADNEIHDDFSFEVSFPVEKDTLYVWRCLNPVNDLVYGFGGVKLYNKFLLLELQRPTSLDVATTVAAKYKPVFMTASTTAFNSSPYEAWRGAFRECTKLTINVHGGKGDKESQKRLDNWCQQGADRPNGPACMHGARQGQQYALANLNQHENLSLINDFDWLKSYFQSHSPMPSGVLRFSTL
jgi:hypothetical protein